MYRVYNALTQKEVAEKLKMPYQDYQKYEYDLYAPKRVNRARLAAALCVDVDIINALLTQKSA